MLKPNDFRRMALGMKDAIEGEHMGHPDFRANGRIFATLHPDLKFGMVKLTPQEQERFVRESPDVFTPESGAWGLAGCTRVTLRLADEETVGEAMTLAWQNSVIKPAARAKRTRPSGATRTRKSGSRPRRS